MLILLYYYYKLGYLATRMEYKVTQTHVQQILDTNYLLYNYFYMRCHHKLHNKLSAMVY